MAPILRSQLKAKGIQPTKPQGRSEEDPINPGLTKSTPKKSRSTKTTKLAIPTEEEKIRKMENLNRHRNQPPSLHSSSSLQILNDPSWLYDQEDLIDITKSIEIRIPKETKN